jgi:alkylation response protein AidB-like acyl-CoA dehydrogenase
VLRAPADHPLRGVVRELLREHPFPTGRQLAEAGLVAPNWPRPYGLDADVPGQLAVDEELAAAGVERPQNQIGIGWAGPTILAGGTAEQQARFLPPMLAGEEIWCQLFSEPGAGSDLASLRTRAIRDGDDYVIHGQKVWTTWADRADHGILLARTSDEPKKHQGISYFLLDMHQPGIEVRPIREMSGGHHFNEVFLDGCRVPVAQRVGEEGDGWRLAVVTLGNERVNLVAGGLCWGLGPTHDDFVALVREQGGVADPVLRQRVGGAVVHGRLIEWLGDRLLRGHDASIRKVLADEHGQRVTELVVDWLGWERTPDDWRWAFLFSRALTIGGGTGEVQRDILGERVLGLPR